MKILMPVLHYYPVIGGLEQWTQNIAERLSEKVGVFVVTGKVADQPKEEIKSGVNIFRTSLFSLRDFSYSSLTYILTSLPFIFLNSLKVIKREKIDLLHCQGFLSSFLGYSLSKLTKTPYIITVQRLEENKGFLRKLVYKNAKVCIAASSAIKKYFEEIGCSNIEIIPNGVELKRLQGFDRQRSRDKLGIKNEFLIMIIARLEKVKGIEYLIKALKQDELFTINYKLFIIGDGSERKNLERLVKNLGLQNRVKFFGEISNKKIPEHLAAADCFVLPSLREGFGIVILEAQAARVPVIGTNIGGIRDIIEDGKTGILVEPKNSEGIALTLIKIHSQPELAQNLVNNALAELPKYNWQNIAQRVNQIYQKILI